MRHLGTPYGGWYFHEDSALRNGTVISCGAGEDISFDVQLASTYGARVFLVDPTPRAIEHVNSTLDRLGRRNSSAFADGGRQKADAYDLEHVRPGQLVLVDKAISSRSGLREFFPPRNQDHVSYSLSEAKVRESTRELSIEVESISYADLLNEYLDVARPALLKLDIEGAEVEVLPHILAMPPRQVLVEYDVLRSSRRARKVWARIHGLLTDEVYALCRVDGLNYTYVQRHIIESDCAHAASS